MVVICIGDVVGAAGCAFLEKHLPSLRRLYGAEIVVANGENSAEGNGMTQVSVQMLFDAGVDVVTSGNHVFRRHEIYDALNDDRRLLRPLNYPDAAPGHGFTVADTIHGQLCVVSLLGTVFMDPLQSPFEAMNRFLSEHGAEGAVLVDFHAEATSEKRAMGYYLDGRAAAVVGTHTHVQTADEEILPGGTGYITDLGMTGPCISVLGVEKEQVLHRYLTHMPVRFSTAPGPCMLNGVVLDIDTKTNRTDSIKRLQVR